MEDQTLTHEVTLFHLVYSTNEHLTVAMVSYAFKGRVQHNFKVCKLIIDSFKVLENGFISKIN